MAADYSQALGTAGAPVEVKLANGQALSLRHFTQEDKAAVEQRVKARARAEVMRDKAELEDAEFRLAYQAFLDSCAAGTYQFGGAVCSGYLRTLDGVGFLVSRLSGVTEAVAADLFRADEDGQILAAFKQVLEESFPKAPGRTTAGSGTSPSPATSAASA